MAVDWSKFKPVQPTQPAQPAPPAIDWSQFTPVAQPAEPAPVQPVAIPVEGPVMRAAPEPTLAGELGRAFDTVVNDTMGRPLIARLTEAGGIVGDALTPDAIQRGALRGRRDLTYNLPTIPTVYGPESDRFRTEVEAASLSREAERYAMSEEDQATLRAMTAEDGTAGQWLDAVRSNPSALGEVIMESAAAQFPALVAQALPGVGPAAQFVSTYGAERVSALDEAMQKAGVDLTNPEAVAEFQRRNPDLVAAAIDKGETRGAIIGATDAATAGLAGRFFRATGLGNAVKRSLADAVLGVGGGAGGEAAAQVATDGRISSIGNVLTEAAAEGPSTVIEGAMNAANARAGGEAPAAPPAPQPQTTPQAAPAAPTPAPAAQAGLPLPVEPAGAATTPAPQPAAQPAPAQPAPAEPTAVQPQAATPTAPPARQQFETPDVLQQREYEAAAQRSGMTPQQIEAVRPKPYVDDVTGYFEGRAGGLKTSTVERAQQHVEQTGEQAYYVDGDIINLGGLNKFAKEDMTVANVHFRAMSDILKQELQATGGDVVAMRTGGDELGLVVVNADEAAIREATARANAKIAEYANANGFGDIDHEKKGRTGKGVGIHTGIAPIMPGLTPKQIFSRASAEIARSKGNTNVEGIAPEGAGAVAPGERSAEPGPGAGPTDPGVRPAGGEPAVAPVEQPAAQPVVAAEPQQQAAEPLTPAPEPQPAAQPQAAAEPAPAAADPQAAAQPAAEPDTRPDAGEELDARSRALEPRVRALSDDDAKAALRAIGEKPRVNRDPRDQLMAQHPDDIDEALASLERRQEVGGAPAEYVGRADQVPYDEARSLGLDGHIFRINGQLYQRGDRVAEHESVYGDWATNRVGFSVWRVDPVDTQSGAEPLYYYTEDVAGVIGRRNWEGNSFKVDWSGFPDHMAPGDTDRTPRVFTTMEAARDVAVQRARLAAERATAVSARDNALLNKARAAANLPIEQWTGMESGETISGLTAGLAAAAKAKAQAAQQKAATKKQVTRKGRPMRPDALMDDAGDMTDAEVDAELGDEQPQRNQRGRGTTPEVQRVSFTNRRSWFEQAFADAGVNPDEATLWPIERQFTTLAGLVKQKFGIDVKKTEVLQGRIAVDQLLDLYRNGQFMAHALGLPSNALGLRGNLTLVLRKGVKYLGAYYPVSSKVEGITVPAGTVVLPKRSNSFAHEWMHALDHYLMQQFDSESEIMLLSQKVKKEGFDGEAGSAKEAFIRVMDNLFFDQASMAARIMSLELQLEKENLAASTRKKIEAQLETLRRGNAQSKSIERTDYRRTSGEYGPADYWANPQEMLARAFEAYTAFKVEAAGGTTEVLAKGDMAYLSDAEDRLAMTFPKGDERLRIFAAFDRLFEAMAKEQLIADGVAANVPGNMQVFDVHKWDRTPARKEEHRGLTGAVRQTVEEIRNDHQQQKRQRERPSNPKSVGQRISDVMRFPFFAERSVFRILEQRYNSPAVRRLANLLVNAPGENRAVGRTYEEAVEQRIKIAFNRLGNIAERYDLNKLDDTGRRTLRDLLISESVPNAPENLVKAAAELRKFLDMEWYRNQQAGLDIGYARNGYLPRLLDMPNVMADKPHFINQATQVYGIIFDREFGADAAEVMSRGDNYSGVAAFLKQAKLAGLDIKPAVKALRALRRLNAKLKTSDDPDILMGKIAQGEEDLTAMIDDMFDDTRTAYGRRRAEQWHTSIMTASAMDFDAMSPDSAYTKSRKLPPQTDKLMEDFYISDPIEAIQHYMMQSARRTEYATRFGPKGEKLQTMFDQMTAEGVSPEDQAYVADMVKRLTGRSGDGLPAAFSGFLNFLHAIGTMTLLPRAVLSSLVEPTAAGIRSGDFTDTAKPYINIVRGVVGTAEAKDWAQIGRAIGALSNSFSDTLVANRFGGTFDSTVKADVMMSRFFQRTMLHGLTNAQRTAIIPLAHQFLLSKAEDIKAGVGGPKVTEQNRAFLRELGIMNPDEFVDWLLQDQAMPTLEQLYDSNGIETKHGAEWMTAVNRYLDQTIQNPKAYDRPGAANTPVGRLIYGILSFSMAFYANVWKRQGTIIKSIAQRRGVVPAVGYAGLQLAPSLFALFVAQTVISTMREAVFNPDRWEEWEKEGTLEENLIRLGFTRSFAFGLADPFIQAYTGLKYQRDLANVMIGAVPGFFMQSIQGLLQPLIQNSEKTNNAEYKAAQSAYQLAASPAIVYALSMAPGGKLVNPLYGLAMMYGTAPAMRDNFADAVVGEKDSRVQARERAERQAAGGTGRQTGRGDGGRETGRETGR